MLKPLPRVIHDVDWADDRIKEKHFAIVGSNQLLKRGAFVLTINRAGPKATGSRSILPKE